MKSELLNELYRPFENIKEKPGSGKYKYVPITDVIDRMNRVFEGNWTSEVIDSEVVEDNILVRVRVYVKDNGNTYYHEGYGSSQIARFSYGDKKGQAVNIGNNYNSAKSLAIKAACKKWGVALFIEDNPYDEEFLEAGTPGPKPTPTPATESFGNTSGSTTPKPAPTKELTPPPFPDPVSEPKAEKTEEADAFGNEIKNEVKLETTDDGQDNITDVQRVAIQGLLELKKLDFKELLINALGREDNLPDSPEKLKYQEAVAVIKYGNKVKK